MVSVNVSLNKNITEISKMLGFSSLNEFVEDAVQKRVLELKKSEFFRLANEVKKALATKGIDESYILADFERARYES